MDNIQEFNFNSYNTLSEAKKMIKLMEEEISQQSSISFDKNQDSSILEKSLTKLKGELELLTNLLMNQQFEDPEEFTKKLDHTYLSILSTSDAFAKLYQALIEVQDKLKEQEKEYNEKARQNKELEKLKEEQREIIQDMEKLIQLSDSLKKNESYELQKQLQQIENYKIHLKNRYGIELNVKLPEINLIV